MKKTQLKHPPIKNNSLHHFVILNMRNSGYRRLRCGEIRRATDVYADCVPVYDFTVGLKIKPGDFVFRKIQTRNK